MYWILTCIVEAVSREIFGHNRSRSILVFPSPTGYMWISFGNSLLI